MNKARTWTIITMAALCIGAAIYGLARNRNDVDSENASSRPETSIEKRIEIMLDAAGKGDVAAYKACFADPLLSKLNAASAELTAAVLRKSEADLNGFSGGQSVVTGDEATIVIEKIYPEHNERYQFRLKRIDGEWKIAGIRGLDKLAPKIKFGTPVVPGLEID